MTIIVRVKATIGGFAAKEDCIRETIVIGEDENDDGNEIDEEEGVGITAKRGWDIWGRVIAQDCVQSGGYG